MFISDTLPVLNKMLEEASVLEEDIRVLGKIVELTDLLKYPHDVS